VSDREESTVPPTYIHTTNLLLGGILACLVIALIWGWNAV
jgi:hypothetical protein